METVGTDTGLAKKINKGAHKLVFDILQATQYSTPIPSTVRELVTNACDSQREKEIAIEILSGQKTVADYYIERHGDQYEDSNFDPSYYDLNYLSSKNKVELTYKHNEGVGYCDVFSIKDYGVGIGGKRLEGILELGYSTKRNTSQNFGAFGLGAKVALSTGVEYYTIETAYNGKRFKVNCYSYKTEFLIPKFNLITGEINPHITLSDGSKVYYEEVTDTNWTVVSLGVKKHNASRFREAVSEQLNYIDNVEFNIIDEGTELPYTRDFKTPVLYNSDTLIISNSYTFTKPHIVIVKDVHSSNGINYGFIDFKELEMQQLYGTIGLKCPIRQVYVNEEGEKIVIQDGVEVTPSREKVIWNDTTKEYIQKLIKAAADEASSIVEAELKEEDFLKWILTCRDVLQKKSDDTSVNSTVIRILSNIVDTSEIKPRYSKDSKIKFASPAFMLPGFQVKHKQVKVVNVDKEDKSRSKGISISGDDCANWNTLNIDSIYIAEDSISRLKDYYLTEQHGGTFTLIYPRNLNYLLDKIEATEDPNEKRSLQREYDLLVENQEKYLPLLKSSAFFKNYDEVEVPESVSLALVSKEEELEASVTYAEETPEQRRVRLNKIVAYSLRQDRDRVVYIEDFTWDKVEPVLNDVINTEYTTYYGTKEDEDKIRLAASISHNLAPRNRDVFNLYYSSASTYKSFYFDCHSSYYTNSKLPDFTNPNNCPQFIRVSQENVSHLVKSPNCKHIDSFFFDVDSNDNLTVNPILKTYITYKYFIASKGITYGEMEARLRYLYRLSSMHECFNHFGKIVRVLDNKYNFSICRFRSTELQNLFSEQESLWSKLIAFEMASKTATAEELTKLSEELFIFTDIPGASVLDHQLLELLRYADEVAEVMNPLIDPLDGVISTATGVALTEYFNLKQLNLLELPLGCSSLTELNSLLNNNPLYDYNKCNRG